LSSVTNRLDAERAELETVLASGMLGRTNNQVRLLTFVCEKYFEGETDEIKEYSIAVQALGRPQDFDPQADTIVRVTAHTLRKRLEEYYRADGAGHAIQISLPAGRYVPNFVRKDESASEEDRGHAPARNVTHQLYGSHSVPFALPKVREGSSPETDKAGGRLRRISITAGLLVSLLFVALIVWYSRNHKIDRNVSGQTQPIAAVSSAPAVRVLLGDNRKPYSDGAGFMWESDRFCSGGESFSVSKPVIQASDDPTLFLSGRRGIFHCKFPMAPGLYEVHLLFAETAGLQENARTVGFSLNGGSTNSLDVVDDAGQGDAAAEHRVLPGVLWQVSYTAS